ncbi:Modifier of mdg4 [Operophtera brumata]|uniref:Modifier of mdg4 n=1 Tax=Operophtera brumata TaxID=104452 RepID=A0A0L7K329_OPEBR|nr:Modifier of mdg4 [Operophtera brumata]
MKKPLFTLSRCGRPVLILGGYRYNKYIRCKGPKVRWNCGGRRNCKASVITFNNEIMFHNDWHNHGTKL